MCEAELVLLAAGLVMEIRADFGQSRWSWFLYIKTNRQTTACVENTKWMTYSKPFPILKLASVYSKVYYLQKNYG